jgi:hypothetical protein
MLFANIIGWSSMMAVSEFDLGICLLEFKMNALFEHWY